LISLAFTQEGSFKIGNIKYDYNNLEFSFSEREADVSIKIGKFSMSTSNTSAGFSNNGSGDISIGPSKVQIQNVFIDASYPRKGYVTESNEAKYQMKNIVQASEIYKMENDSYPPDCWETLKEEGYLEIKESITKKWEFECSFDEDGEGGTLSATSTEEMRDGGGKKIEYNKETGKYTGYGQSNSLNKNIRDNLEFDLGSFRFDLNQFNFDIDDIEDPNLEDLAFNMKLTASNIILDLSQIRSFPPDVQQIFEQIGTIDELALNRATISTSYNSSKLFRFDVDGMTSLANIKITVSAIVDQIYPDKTQFQACSLTISNLSPEVNKIVSMIQTQTGFPIPMTNGSITFDVKDMLNAGQNPFGGF
tara:strand:- start:4638 stop:5726 length:1089 start_codon:yes stop_codon:yes gene_type:complete